MIMGFFLVRPIPLPAQEGYDIVEDADLAEDDFEAVSPTLHHRNNSHAHLLAHDFIEPHHPHYIRHVDGAAARQEGDSYVTMPEEVQLNASRHVDDGEHAGEARHSRSLSRGTAMALDKLPNVYGRKLFRTGDFWLLFGILSIRESTRFINILSDAESTTSVSGTGLMCRFSVA